MAALAHNSSTIDVADWAYEVAQSKAHAYIKLIVHTLRVLMHGKEPDVEVSDEELGRLTSLSVRTVQRYRNVAEQEGWISPRVGRGRSKVTIYRISVPMQTLCELSDRLNAINKNTTDSPVLEEKKATASLTDSQKATHSPQLSTKNRTVSQTGGPVLKKEIPPTPPKEKNNITTLDWRTREGQMVLADTLLDACNGAAANPASFPGILVLAEPIRWLEGGCDIDLDIVPTIRARAHKLRPGSVKNWSYFTQAIADAKASREAPMPTAAEARPRWQKLMNRDEMIKAGIKPDDMKPHVWERLQADIARAKAAQ